MDGKPRLVCGIPVHCIKRELDGEDGDGASMRLDKGLGYGGALLGFRVCAGVQEITAGCPNCPVCGDRQDCQPKQAELLGGGEAI
jgi:hypothetical protein